MAKISAFRSDEARAAYCRLYDAALATSPMPLTETCNRFRASSRFSSSWVRTKRCSTARRSRPASGGDCPGRVELLDNANHIVTVDQPEVVEHLLAGFLR
ncbi:hypothetical protein BST11_20090 [Mycobacterium alsense]|uniref:Uncharacterized protein n=1 Tax=Mycobacterium alsense TaxID=324058 RepID=A0AA41XU79_9MYCO|nr:hypothetical protein [Mycobacterium alsense]MCV7381272.1 hypothetical protein [Mycobacterium alsense]OQZ88992.1 hypothetical protein BST11_20090 [Mycobacterium alsense]